MNMMKTRPSLVALSGALFLAAGCGKNGLPATYPVTGTVSFSDGQPLPGGSITFQLTAPDAPTISGEIKEDGAFRLSTFRESSRSPGAPEGVYSVTVVPPLVEHRLLMPPVTLPTSYEVKPRENHFDVKVDRPPSR